MSFPITVQDIIDTLHGLLETEATQINVEHNQDCAIGQTIRRMFPGRPYRVLSNYIYLTDGETFYESYVIPDELAATIIGLMDEYEDEDDNSYAPISEVIARLEKLNSSK